MCIDKLDLRIPQKTQFTPEFQEVYSHAASRALFKPSNYYTKTADFRTYGYEARLHMYSAYGRKFNNKVLHDHKLELYGVGEMKFDEMVAEISRIFACDPLELEMMRRDVCVDVVGVGLNWFKSHTRVEFKRNLREIGYMDSLSRKGCTRGEQGKPFEPGALR